MLFRSDVISYAEKAKLEFSKVFSGEIDPGLALQIGVRKVNLGPVSLTAKLTGGDLKFKSDEKGTGFDYKFAGTSVEAKFGPYKVKSEYFLFDGDVKYNTDDGFTSTINYNYADPPNVEAGKEGFTIDNSTNIGGGMNLFGTDISANINIGHFLKGCEYSLIAFTYGLKDKFNDLFHQPRGTITPGNLSNGSFDMNDYEKAN